MKFVFAVLISTAFAVPAWAGCDGCNLIDDTPFSNIIGAVPLADCNSCNYTDDAPPIIVQPAPTADCGTCG
jgi:hypothetical protein